MADDVDTAMRARAWMGAAGAGPVPLELVPIGRAEGIVIPQRAEGAPAYRGPRGVDYACGRCGALLAAGVPAGMFERVVFACGCGALNRIRRLRARKLSGSRAAAGAPTRGRRTGRSP